MDQFPCLLGKHCQIKGMEVTKAHSPLLFLCAKFFPIYPMDLHFFFCFPPPILCQQRVDVVTCGFGQFEDAHGICLDCLTIVLIRTSRLAFEMNFSFYLITRFVIFSCRSLNVDIFDFPLAIGMPRYLSICVIILSHNICWINVLTSGFVFLLKNKAVFLRLMA